MAGGWRISIDEAVAELRRARRDARELRTQAAWDRVAEQVARCERLGVFDQDPGAAW